MRRPLKWVLGGLFALAIAAGLTFASVELGASPANALAMNCIGTCPPHDDDSCFKACKAADFEFGGACTPGGSCCCFK